MFVSHWHGHVRGWEGSMASRSSGFGSPGLSSEMSFPSFTVLNTICSSTQPELLKMGI